MSESPDSASTQAGGSSDRSWPPRDLRRRLRQLWLPEPDLKNEFPYSVDELVARLKTSDAELAADILTEAEAIYERVVDGRVESVERRAATLQGVVAIAATFVFTGGTLLVSQVEGSEWRVACGVVLLMSVASFVLCGLRATQATSRWQAWSVPPARAIFQRPSDGIALGRVAQAAAILRSTGRNSSLARLKVTLMRKSVWHLQNALLTLVALAVVLVTYAIAEPRSTSTATRQAPAHEESRQPEPSRAPR